MWWVIQNRAWMGGNIRPHHSQAGPFKTKKLAIAWMKKKDIKPLSFEEWEEQQEKKRSGGII
tara:strand:+ start:421 stop:606 length:186 start_codon:yes stop_codon:yes gene_type:complete